MTLRGIDEGTLRGALQTGTPFPGTSGFAGHYQDSIFRDVLGREPVFVGSGTNGSLNPQPGRDWAFEPTVLDEPVAVPAGSQYHDGDVSTRWDVPTPSPDSTACDRVAAALDETLMSVPESAPVAFSGGVDSALVASGCSGPLYVTGFPGSHDIEAAESAATAMDRELRVIELDHDDIRSAAKHVAQATGRTNAMDVSIGIPLYVIAKQATADGYDQLILGQGADELFGGYAKVAKAPEDPRVEATTSRGARNEVVKTLPAQLERDVLTVRAGGVEPICPLLHDSVIMAALALPENELVVDGTRKVGLRTVAKRRIPESIVTRDKKALQYGTLVSREIDRLARQAGFKRRMTDHVSRYITEILCRDSTVPKIERLTAPNQGQ